MKISVDSNAMNSLGDYPALGTIPLGTYSAPFYVNALTPNQLPMPPLSTKSKPAISYHNGYPTVTAAATMTRAESCYNGPEYSKSNHGASEGESQLHKPVRSQGKAEIQMNGNVKNLPKSMLVDQYGIAGFIVGRKAVNCRRAFPFPDDVSNDVLAEMHVQKKDSINEPLLKRFHGPLGLPGEPESFSAEVDQGAPVYPEYLVTHRMIFESREPDMNHMRKTWALKIDKFGDDLLFYLFYTCTQDVLQLLAASNLYHKGWRYHTEAKVWLRRQDNGHYVQDTGNRFQEKGIYKYFDYNCWKIAQVDMVLDTSKLEGPPEVPSEIFLSSANPKI